MTYIPSLNKVQIGLESTYNDGAAATIEPAGITVININPQVEVEQLMDKRGDAMPAHDAFVKRRWSEGAIEGYLDYNRAYVWLDGMFGKATPDGGVYTYSGSTTGASGEQSLALYYGQTDLIYKAAGVLPSELNISGATGEPLNFRYSFFGQPASDGASFTVLTADTPEFAFGYDTTIYLDEGLDATVGSTEMTDIGFRFNATINNAREPVWHLGNQAPDTYKIGKWGGSLELVLEADATMLVHLGDILDATDTPKSYAVRIRSTDGTNTLDLDFVGTAVVAPTVITDEDGIVTVELRLVPQYGTTMETCWKAQLTVA